MTLFQVKELLPDEVLEQMHASDARARFAPVPTLDPKQLGEADAVIFGTPTRSGNVCAPMEHIRWRGQVSAPKPAGPQNPGGGSALKTRSKADRWS